MPEQQPDEASLACEIEFGLQRIALAPDDVTLHQQLRATALRYKAAGGRAAGMLQQLPRPQDDAVQRLLRVERLWSLDAGNLSIVPKVFAALAALERADSERDFSAVRRWLYGIQSAGADEV